MGLFDEISELLAYVDLENGELAVYEAELRNRIPSLVVVYGNARSTTLAASLAKQLLSCQWQQTQRRFIISNSIIELNNTVFKQIGLQEIHGDSDGMEDLLRGAPDVRVAKQVALDTHRQHASHLQR